MAFEFQNRGPHQSNGVLQAVYNILGRQQSASAVSQMLHVLLVPLNWLQARYSLHVCHQLLLDSRYLDGFFYH